MICKIYFVLVLSSLLSSCAFNDAKLSGLNDEAWLVEAVRDCIDAQINIGNPLFDSNTRKPKSKNINYVQVTKIPKVFFYELAIDAKPPYPDAPFASCYIEKSTGFVLRATYQLGEPGVQNKEVVFKKYDRLGGVSAQELDLLIEQKEIEEYSLHALLIH